MNANHAAIDGDVHKIVMMYTNLCRQLTPFLEFDLLTKIMIGNSYTGKCCADIIRALRIDLSSLVETLRAVAISEADKPHMSVHVGNTPLHLQEQREEFAFIVNSYVNSAPLAASQIKTMEQSCKTLIDASEQHVATALSVPRIIRDAVSGL